MHFFPSPFLRKALSSKCPCADLANMTLETAKQLKEQICLKNWQILTAEDVEINHIQIPL